MAEKKTIAIVGAGPIGIAAALGAIQRNYEPIVFERGAHVGATLDRYGPSARFFSPLSMNLTTEMSALLRSVRPADSLMTGPEMALVLREIAASPALAKHVHCNHEVKRITRDRLARGDHAGHPVRGEMQFRVVVAPSQKGGEGEERTVIADAVLDASGVYAQPVPLAASGSDSLPSLAIVIRHLADLHERRAEIAKKRVLVIGHGHSAANAMLVLEAIAKEEPSTHVTWALRSRNLRPCEIVPSDPLPERERVVSAANALAQKPRDGGSDTCSWLRVERAAFVESFKALGPGEGVLASLTGDRSAKVDVVIALTGYRPDLAPLSELPIEVSAATEGAMRLRNALANVTDCLSVPKIKVEDLASGEPRFHMIGVKSYGRARTFLLQTGYAQVETILDHLFAV